MSPALVIFAIFMFLVYIFRQPIKIEKFTNSQEVAAKVDKVFKKNFDLDYYDATNSKHISEMSKILSNRIAPIMNSSTGRKEKGVATVQAIPKKLTTRIPDKMSNKKEYKIPMPKFDDVQNDLFKPLMKSFKELNEMREVNYPKVDTTEYIGEEPPVDPDNQKPKEEKKELFNDSRKKIQVRKISNQNYCKFVTSFGKDKAKCPKDYSVFTGATFSGRGSTLNCNGDTIDVKPAQGFAIIRNGNVIDVKITERGSSYDKAPRVYFRGAGKGAQAKSVIKNGVVTDIIVTNGGQGYNSTPTVIIEKPNPLIRCNLCCKNEL